MLVPVEKAFSKVYRALDFTLVEGLVAEAVMDDEGVMGVHATLPHPLTHDILHSFLEDIVVNSTCSVYTRSFLEERAHSAWCGVATSLFWSKDVCPELPCFLVLKEA